MAIVCFLHSATRVSKQAIVLQSIAEFVVYFSVIGCKTAGDKPEEGEDDFKSSCPLCLGRHTCYNGRDKGSRSPREGELTPKTRPQFELQAATRLHEAGIASNRRSATRR
ncbi:hypothetical protein R6Q59_004651 [Mikania micrantha]